VVELIGLVVFVVLFVMVDLLAFVVLAVSIELIEQVAKFSKLVKHLIQEQLF
jgi:hypothetical protein